MGILNISKDKLNISKDKFKIPKDKINISLGKFKISQDIFILPKDKFKISKDKFNISQDIFILSCEEEKEMPDFLSNLSDSEVVAIAKYFAGKVSVNPESKNLTEEFADEIGAEVDTLTTDYSEHLLAKAAARSKCRKKDDSIKRVKSILRKAAAKVRLKDGVTKAELVELKILPRVDSSASDATRPFGRIDTSNRFTHVLLITDEAEPELKRKPKGAVGCEIFVKIGGDLPQGLSECRFATIALKAKCVIEFEGEDVGKQAHYILRWLLRDGSVSPISETLSATVTG